MECEGFLKSVSPEDFVLIILDFHMEQVHFHTYCIYDAYSIAFHFNSKGINLKRC